MHKQEQCHDGCLHFLGTQTQNMSRKRQTWDSVMLSDHRRYLWSELKCQNHLSVSLLSIVPHGRLSLDNYKNHFAHMLTPHPSPFLPYKVFKSCLYLCSPHHAYWQQLIRGGNARLCNHTHTLKEVRQGGAHSACHQRKCLQSQVSRERRGRKRIHRYCS